MKYTLSCAEFAGEFEIPSDPKKAFEMALYLCDESIGNELDYPSLEEVVEEDVEHE